MTLPANVRVNAQVPFPSLVQGSGPVTVSKVRGIWTLGLQFINLITGTPSAARAQYLLLYDVISGQFWKVPVSSFANAAGTARLPVAAASVPILTIDIEVGINTGTAPTTCPLPSVASWAAANPNGLELTIFDATGQALTNNVTPSLSAGDTFLQDATPVITQPWGLIKLRPIIGVSNSWYVRGVN